MKTLVVYYSWKGNTEVVASEIASSLGADLLKLEEIKKRPGGILGFLISGMQGARASKTGLKPINCNLSDYDRIFIGTPIWASGSVPAVNTFGSEPL